MTPGRKSIYPALRKQLLKLIRDKRLLPGDLLPSEMALSREFGVSRPTLRKALGDLEGQGLIERRAGKGTYVAEPRPEAQPQGLLIGIDTLAVREMAHWYYDKLIAGAMARLGRAGRLVQVDREEIASGRVAGIDGLILMGVELDQQPALEELARGGLPVMMINRVPASPLLGYVAVDYRREAMLGTLALLDLGHRRIAYVGRGQELNGVAGQRFAGFRDALAQRNVSLDTALQVVGEDDPRPVIADVRRLLDEQQPTALFVHNAKHLMAVCQVLTQRGLQVPDDLQIVCFDNVEELTHHLGQQVSEIHMPLKTMGREAMAGVLDHLEKSAPLPRIMHRAELILRGNWQPEAVVASI